MTNEDYKAFFRQLASGVCVVTFRIDAQLHGFTATSVTSVSAVPPVALFCVGQRNESYRHISIGSSIGISILGRHQKHLSDRFAAKSGPGGYEQVETVRMPCGVPALKGTLCQMEAGIVEIIPVGDHAVVLVRVEEIHISAGSTPILYHDGEYHRLAPL